MLQEDCIFDELMLAHMWWSDRRIFARSKREYISKVLSQTLKNWDCNTFPFYFIIYFIMYYKFMKHDILSWFLWLFKWWKTDHCLKTATTVAYDIPLTSEFRYVKMKQKMMINKVCLRSNALLLVFCWFLFWSSMSFLIYAICPLFSLQILFNRQMWEAEMMMTLSMQKWERGKEGKAWKKEKMPCKIELVCLLKIATRMKISILS